MRRRSLPVIAVALALIAPAFSSRPAMGQEADPSRLYGRIQTTDGSLYEGYIRWGANEAGVFDILHASKRIPERNRRDAERLGWEPDRGRNRIEIFGIGFDLPATGSPMSGSAQSGIRFGRISSLEVAGSGARLLLKSGEEVEFRSGGDLGSSVGEILVEDIGRGQVELDWRDVRAIDFMSAPRTPSSWGDRLYGTLVTRGGERFTGYIAWDMDEVFTTDVLDGDERGRDREIPFGQIRSIAQAGSSAARVTLVDGEEVELRGSNDVDHRNRDIMVADPALGEIRVEWEQLDRLELAPPPSVAVTSSLHRSGRLRGTVRARGGEVHAGWIRWDNDEEFAWEILDGALVDGVDLDIELGRVAAIERVAYDASKVTLRDGRSFVLSGSNDVDEGNKGVYVERADGTLVLVPWDRFERVDFDV